MGLLKTNGELDHDEDIDQVIERARVANYSFVNGAYSFSKGTVNLGTEEEKVLLDDPDFWQKVFKDQEEPIQKLIDEFEGRKKDGMFR